ncbi:conserved hypothetical protein [[Clostridium] ultunense Esp]|uniref:Oxidoreductase domain protein n=1 Tax=[Clostridium] ultunense Esp TaxID=1288971 RepID=M1ZAM4_9FIRM|nr:Gfo/Idh/MocA family oxidoreductase [Schnuerera ultunensis]CCQ95326.1 conserved hypothetical protein [[Clostridium] ultunense Esp]SHD76281.1 conserved protein of unknown function [[Clostridium] ultunense Esp]
MKVGIIGTGAIVNSFLEAVSMIDGIKCLGIYSRSKEKGLRLANEFNIQTIYTDLDTMLDDERINFIYVASPNSLHYSQSLKALKKGKHVICEKPFTSTLEETKTLSKMARNNGLYLFEAITTIHLPNYKIIKDNIKRLGRIKIVQASYCQYSSRYDQLLAGEIPNVFNPKMSGGALADINVYNIHFVMGIFGEPNEIYYMANKHVNGIDTSGVVFLRYPDFICICTGSKDVQGNNLVQIQGEKGYIQVNEGANGCKSFTININNEKSEYIDIQSSPNILYYEMLKFHRIYKDKDLETCYKLLDHTESVMKVLVKARKDAGIIFSADNNTENII